MLRTVLPVSLALLGSAFAWPQEGVPPTPREVLSATLADLHGLEDIIELSEAQSRSDRTALWLSVVSGPAVSPARLAPRDRTPAGTVSAKRLRHRPPKAARQAYEKAGRNKDPRKAASELEKAIALDPDFAEAHNDLGAAYALLGRYPEAVKELRRAIELVPDESLPHSNLAWVLFATGQRAEAEASVRRAIQLSPDNAAAHMLIGRMLIDSPETLAEGRWHLEYAARTMPEAKQMVRAMNKKQVSGP